MKFSANIISATVYLFVGSPCLRVVVGADPYKIAENFGAFRLRTNKTINFFMKVLWFSDEVRKLLSF